MREASYFDAELVGSQVGTLFSSLSTLEPASERQKNNSVQCCQIKKERGEMFTTKAIEKIHKRCCWPDLIWESIWICIWTRADRAVSDANRSAS